MRLQKLCNQQVNEGKGDEALGLHDLLMYNIIIIIIIIIS